MNASPSRYLWTSISTSGALHLAAVAGLLAAGGSTQGWALRAYTPPPGFSAPQLTLRMPATASRQEVVAELTAAQAVPSNVTTKAVGETTSDAIEARQATVTPANRELLEVAPSAAHQDHVTPADGERLVVMPQGIVRVASRSDSFDARPKMAEPASPSNSPPRTPAVVRVATQTGLRVDSRTDAQADPRVKSDPVPRRDSRVEPTEGPRRDSDGRSTANSSASRASERRSGVAASLPEKIFSPQPDYPAEELAAGHEGRVLLRVTVNARGLVESAVVQRSSGFPALDEAAQAAVRRWRFKTADADVVASDPQATREVAIPIRFEIQR